jgi:hypothetical protein
LKDISRASVPVHYTTIPWIFFALYVKWIISDRLAAFVSVTVHIPWFNSDTIRNDMSMFLRMDTCRKSTGRSKSYSKKDQYQTLDKIYLTDGIMHYDNQEKYRNHQKYDDSPN